VQKQPGQEWLRSTLFSDRGFHRRNHRAATFKSKLIRFNFIKTQNRQRFFTDYEARMQQELLLKAISHRSIALLIIVLFLVLLVALRKQSDGNEPLRGTIHIGLLIMGLCTFIALMVGYYQAKKTIVPESVSQRMDIVSDSQAGRTSALLSLWS
jgi:hypothetical protein